MKYLVLLIVCFSWLAHPLSQPLAQEQYHDYDFKSSLKTYTELFTQSPQSVHLALKTAELVFLVEGRTPAIKLLRDFLEKQKRTLSPQEAQEIQRKIIVFSNRFLLEEAQTHYLQAELKTKLKDWKAGLAPITQAAALEPGNLKVLLLKSEIEQRVGLPHPAYQSLKEAYWIDPQSEKIVDRLSEAHIFHGHYDAVCELLEKNGRTALSNRNKLALAVAKWELGKKSEGQKLVEELMRNKKQDMSQHPALIWMVYRIQFENSPDSIESKSALKTFRKSAHPNEKLLLDGWDPYRLASQLAQLTQ